MSVVQFVTADSWGPNETGTSFTTFLPSDCQAGDAIFVFIFSDSAINSAPSGWTYVNSISGNDRTSPDGTSIYVYKKASVSPADNDTETGAWTRNAVGEVTIVLYQCRCDTGAEVQYEGFNTKVQINTGYSIGMSSLSSTVSGSLFVAAAMSRIYDNVTLPSSASQPAQYAVDADLSRAENGRHVWGHASVGPDTEVATFDNFTLNPGSSTTNTMASFVILLSPGGLGVTGTSYPVEVIEGFRCVPGTGATMRSVRAVSDAMGVSDVTVTLLAKILRDQLGVADALAVTGRYGLTLTENAVALASALSVAFPKTASDTLSFAEALSAARAAQVIDRIGLNEAITPNGIYGLTLLQAVRVSDSLRRFFAGDLIDTVGITSDLLAKPIMNASANDAVAVVDAIAPQMVFRVTAREGLEISLAGLVGMIYAGHALDTVDISAGLVEPNGSVSTWSINLKNGGVSEYKNFAFNSFAQMGVKYLGASSDGLYDLTGDTDDGEQIIARLKSGFMQFGSMHLSSIKGVYLGIRGGGNFVLKIEDGAGNTTVYGANVRDFETTRIRTGKGLRARFFRFELTSTGQDFDLEAIEFIPLVAQRRG